MAVIDINAGLPGGYYSTVTVEFRIGTSVGRQAALRLVQSSPGRWRLA